MAPSPALRAGLRALLSSDDEIRILVDSDRSNNSIDKINEADVIITSASSVSFFDDEMGASLTSPKSASASILFLSNEPLNVRELTRSQSIWGVLPLDASADELLAAIHALSQGLIVGERSLLFASEEETLANSPLTDRETEVLNLLSKGLANKQIAVSLGISEHTVKFHVSSIYAKLNVTNRTEAVRAGLRSGWVAL
ncbi:MAG: response regulator transcription factor [Anaerolineales bacterium]